MVKDGFLWGISHNSGLLFNIHWSHSSFSLANVRYPEKLTVWTVLVECFEICREHSAQASIMFCAPLVLCSTENAIAQRELQTEGRLAGDVDSPASSGHWVSSVAGFVLGRFLDCCMGTELQYPSCRQGCPEAKVHFPWSWETFHKLLRLLLHQRAALLCHEEACWREKALCFREEVQSEEKQAAL